MNFNTAEFLLLFLPVQVILFYVVRPRFRLFILLLGSIFFYGMSSDIAGFLLVNTILWAGGIGYISSKMIHNSGWLTLAIFPPFLLLFLFKYLDFTLTAVDPNDQLRSSFQFILKYALPAGISFYTFQIASYLIDVHDGKVEREKNPLVFAVFAAFFPQLIAGPILRFHELRDQLRFIAAERNLRPDFPRAFKFISVGLAYKIFLADVLRRFQETHDVSAGGGSLDAAYAVLAYSFIIYFDFWAYSLMAIGLAKLFCIELPRNFLEPYKSTSPREFWRRWHVTLSFWLRDYVYLKIGGNTAYIRNIAIVFLACGLWHGAGWNFLIWGGYHALLVIAHHLAREPWGRLPGFVQITITFMFVSLGWPLFYNGIEEYGALISVLFAFQAPTDTAQFGYGDWLYLAIPALIVFATREDRWLFNENYNRFLDSPLFHAGLTGLSLMFLNFGRTFIYFQF